MDHITTLLKIGRIFTQHWHDVKVFENRCYTITDIVEQVEASTLGLFRYQILNVADIVFTASLKTLPFSLSPNDFDVLDEMLFGPNASRHDWYLRTDSVFHWVSRSKPPETNL